MVDIYPNPAIIADGRTAQSMCLARCHSVCWDSRMDMISMSQIRREKVLSGFFVWEAFPTKSMISGGIVWIC